MNTRKREWILLVLSMIGGILWYVIDTLERGYHISNFGGPVFVIGTIGVPSVISIVKDHKKNKTEKA